MKKSLRIISFVLVLLTVISMFAACGGTKPQNGDESNNVATTGGAEDNKALPDMDWGGEQYRLLGREGSWAFQKNFEMAYEEMPQDVVGVAVWNRNIAIKDKYGLEVVAKFDSSPYNVAKISLEAGDDLYDLVACSPELMHNLAEESYLVNLIGAPYINFEHETWNAYANEQLTMGGKLFYTTNKFLLQDKHRSWAMFYNRTMAREVNAGYFEDFVFDGTWTIDKLIELSKLGAKELDGAQGMSMYDQFGMVLGDRYAFVQILYGMGFRLSEKGSNGYPKLVGTTDQILAMIDKAYELAKNVDVTFCDGVRMDPAENATETGLNIFYAGRGLVVAEAVSELDNMDKIDFEFGILPNPKYNENQENYYAIPNRSNGSLFGVPATVENVDKAMFGLEAISEESVDTSYFEYIETKCKLQDAYDEDAAKCLDIIFDGVVYDIVFTSDIGGLGQLASFTLIEQNATAYTRLYDRMAKIANNEVKQIKEIYEAQ